jgi:hypothetical protein
MNRTWPNRIFQYLEDECCCQSDFTGQDDDFLLGKVPDFFPDLTEDEE